jgi:aminoglycoside phosphotransferase family enzyme
MTMQKSPADLINFLLEPESYPEKPVNVTHIETHISHVFVCDTFVYKIKKPVNFGFLDFSSLKKRQYFCNKEVILNTRLAKDIYLNVVPIYEANGYYSFIENKNRPVEYAVKMKRIPMECLLFNLIAEGRPLYRDLEEVGRTLALFHGNIKPYRGKKFGGIKTILAATEENFEQIKPFCGITLDQPVYETIMSYTRNFLDKNKKLFGSRKGHGFIRDGHGDLHCQHICLEHPPVIFDCIEFNNSFRVIDILQAISLTSTVPFMRISSGFTRCIALLSGERLRDLQQGVWVRHMSEGWQQQGHGIILTLPTTTYAMLRGPSILLCLWASLVQENPQSQGNLHQAP